MRGVKFLCLVLALVAAAVYFLMAAGIVTVPSIYTDDPEFDPTAIVYVAAGCYALGGLLILAGKRWLWIIGLVMNTLVIAIFYMMYKQEPEIMLSFPGLSTKIAQILLEFGLLYLIFGYKKKSLSRR